MLRTFCDCDCDRMLVQPSELIPGRNQIPAFSKKQGEKNVLTRGMPEEVWPQTRHSMLAIGWIVIGIKVQMSS